MKIKRGNNGGVFFMNFSNRYLWILEALVSNGTGAMFSLYSITFVSYLYKEIIFLSWMEYGILMCIYSMQYLVTLNYSLSKRISSQNIAWYLFATDWDFCGWTFRLFLKTQPVWWDLNILKKHVGYTNLNNFEIQVYSRNVMNFIWREDKLLNWTLVKNKPMVHFCVIALWASMHLFQLWNVIFFITIKRNLAPFPFKYQFPITWQFGLWIFGSNILFIW